MFNLVFVSDKKEDITLYVSIFIIIVCLILCFAIYNKIIKKRSIKDSFLLPIINISFISCIFLIFYPFDEKINEETIQIIDGVIYEKISNDNYSEFYNDENINSDIFVYEYYYFDMLEANQYPTLDLNYFKNNKDYMYPYNTCAIATINSYEDISGYYCITGYTENIIEDVIVPEYIDGIKVCAVGYNALNNAPIKSFTATKYLTYHPYSMSECDELEYINIASGELMPLAFSNLNNLIYFNTAYNLNENSISSNRLIMYDASMYNIDVNTLELYELYGGQRDKYILEYYPCASLKYPLIHNSNISKFIIHYLDDNSYNCTDIGFVDDVLYGRFDLFTNKSNSYVQPVIYINSYADTFSVPIIKFDFDYYTPIFVSNDKLIWDFFNILSKNNDDDTIYINLINDSDINTYEIVDDVLMVNIISNDILYTYELLDLSNGNFEILYS